MNDDFPSAIPRDVVSITIPQAKAHRGRWILIAARDGDCDIGSVEVRPDGDVNMHIYDGEVSYRDLWDRLWLHARGSGSTWVLMFRSRHVLASADWIDALTRGEIQLERQRKRAGKQAGVGKIGISQSFLEIDIRVAGRKLKLLDWQNFGVDLADHELGGNTYTIHDCLRAFEGLIKSLDKVGLSAAHTSAAQIGWNKLRRSMGGSNIFTSLQPEVRELERRCYYGGRCEAYRVGRIDGRCYYMDVRSCYAWVCGREWLPTMPIRYYPVGLPLADIDFKFNSSWAAGCIVSTEWPRVPVTLHGRTVYPVGEFHTHLCGAEFESALKSGIIKKITRAVKYVTLPVLADYADWYLRAKDTLGSAGLKAHVGALKATFNSSLGFFARQGRAWLPWHPAGSPPWFFGITDAPGPPGGVVRCHTIDGMSEWLSVGSEPRNASPIVHASICAFARIKLMTLMMFAGPENVYYVDTDGLIVSQAGYDNLLSAAVLDSDGAGQLSLRSQGDHCVINALKSYRIGSRVTCAGMTREQHSQWEPAKKFDVKWGRLQDDGSVLPIQLRCEDVGGIEARYVNEEVLDELG